MSEGLEKLKAILREQFSDAEVQAILSELITASGDGAVAIGEGASGAIIVPGNGNKIIIHRGMTAEEITQVMSCLLEQYRLEYSNLKNATYAVQRESYPVYQKQHNISLDSGLHALTDLMQSPEAGFAVTGFCDDFQRARRQVKIIDNYKALHDLLHTLEFQCYNGIVHESKRFPNDETALEILIDHELTLQNILRDIKELIGQKDFAIHTALWVEELNRAQVEFHAALEELEIQRLQITIRLLHKILTFQPSVINDRLNIAALTLDLPTLIRALKSISNNLIQIGLNPDKVKHFHVGIDLLEHLNENLEKLLTSHNFWQDFDRELRRIEDWARKDWTELEISWPDLVQKMAVLFDSSKDQWAISFQQDSKDLNQAITTQNSIEIRRCFRKYRRRASDRFYQVDIKLKRLCEELREIGTPLDAVLRMME
ncbi:MAG: toll/interleukin-1 receptor domain-containing protein [Cyanobacteria bacterium P01_D01_bin.56]